jgi:hypothetical protein
MTGTVRRSQTACLPLRCPAAFWGARGLRVRRTVASLTLRSAAMALALSWTARRRRT